MALVPGHLAQMKLMLKWVKEWQRLGTEKVKFFICLQIFLLYLIVFNEDFRVDSSNVFWNLVSLKKRHCR